MGGGTGGREGQAELTASVYITASFQSLCSAWYMGTINAILQMGTLKSLPHSELHPPSPFRPEFTSFCMYNL